MAKPKKITTKEFADQQLKELASINSEIKRRTKRLILLAVAANTVLLLTVFILIKFVI